jgi:F-type H+-transporting ATPase subunit epsilon
MLNFKIVTPAGVIYHDQVEQVTVPTTSGEITILPKHIPIVSVLKAGELIIQKDGHKMGLSVSGGIIEMQPDDKLFIMADTAERAEHIDIARAEEGRKRAEELLKQKENVADVDFARIQASLERELIRIKVAKKYKK